MVVLEYIRDLVTLTLDEEKCNGCGFCLEVCPRMVFEKREKKVAMVQRDYCMECGACSTNCPTGALTVTPGVGCAYAVLFQQKTKSSCCDTCSCG